MKLFRRISILTFVLLLIVGFSCSYAQTTKEAKIKTEFGCSVGKANIETCLTKEPGVQSAIADLETKVVTITYDAIKTDQEKLVAAIEKCGYRTEFTPADKEIKHSCTHDTPTILPQKTE
jgi:copper chaperone CopZ